MSAGTHDLHEAVRLHRAGRYDEADCLYRGILRVDPAHADAWHLSGLCAVQRGDSAAGLASLRRAVELRPASAVYRTSLGTALKNCGNDALARKHFQTALVLQPASMEARFNLANLHLAQEDFEQAVTLYREADRLRPGNAEVLNNLGTSLRHLGHSDEAERRYREALAIRPEHPGVLQNLAALLHSQSRFHEASELYLAARQHQPDNVALRNNSAACLHDCGRFLEAEAELRDILRERPDFVAAWINLGCVCNDLNRSAEAAECFQRALFHDPESSTARNNLGNALKALGRFDEAAAQYSRAMQSRPEFAEAISNLAGIRQSQGRTVEARELLHRANTLRPDPLREFEQAVLLPPVYRSQSHLDECRQRLEEGVAELRRRGVVIDPAKRIVPAMFYASYHGRNDRELMSATAELFDSSFDFRRFRRERGRGDRIRIGILSAYLGDHTIGRLMSGIIEHLSRERFDVTLLVPEVHSARLRQWPQGGTQVVELTRRLNVALERAAAAGLDVLVYPDVGMDPLTTTLARTRLAPLQCVMWGHPVTTGMPAIDWFLSSKLLETDRAAEHYSEQLVLLDRLPCCYPRPDFDPTVTQRVFHLPDDRPLYLCPQSLFKFHPEFDGLLAEILNRDRDGLLVLLDPPHEFWKQTLLERWAGTIGRHVERIRWLPRMSRERFLQLLSLSDVMLDPPHFGGGNTNYEAFGQGVPVVTLPSEFLRGRVALGMSRAMGITSCIARSAEDYVARAVAIANDPELHGDTCEAIRRSSPNLFDDVAAVRELESFWIAETAR